MPVPRLVRNQTPPCPAFVHCEAETLNAPRCTIVPFPTATRWPTADGTCPMHTNLAPLATPTQRSVTTCRDDIEIPTAAITWHEHRIWFTSRHREGRSVSTATASWAKWFSMPACPRAPAYPSAL
eukprot:jgi/Mesvir1/13440/Mv25624-RA.1